MIETTTARDLLTLLLQIEERLTRLLTSGWRQASGEAADLQQEADALTEAGLPELGARVAAVASATDAASALQAIALASSACQLMRTRLLTVEPPTDWPLIRPPKPRKRTTDDILIPLARLQVAATEVWACIWSAQNQVILLEPPLPDLPEPAPPTNDAPVGMLARLQRRISQALDGAREPSSVWLHEQIGGTLQWAGRYPLGATGDIAACTLAEAHWIEKPEGTEADQLLAFRKLMAANTMRPDGPLTWSVSNLRVARLEQRDWAAYAWIDPSAAEAFGSHSEPEPWALVWLANQIVMPLALLEPGGSGRQSRIVHLMPGLPSDVVSPEA